MSLSSQLDEFGVSSHQSVMQLGPSLQQQGGMATVQNLLMSMELAGFSLFHIPTHDEGSVSHRLQVFARALGRCVRQLHSKQAPAIAHLHMSERGSVARVLVLIALISRYRTKIVVHTHGAEFQAFYDQQAPWRQALIKQTLRRGHHLIVLSDFWRDYYANCLGLSPNQISVLHNPVSIPPPQSRPLPQPEQPFHLVFLGRIGARKGTFKLLESVAQLNQDPDLQTIRRPLHLTLAGDGEIEAARDLAQTLNIESQVSFPGWLNAVAAQDLLAQADAFILPSLNEGLPMAILEAMSWGLPIIASPVGGIPEVVVPMETGLLVDPQASGEITQAIATLVKDPQLCQVLGRNAYGRIQGFSTQTYQTKLTELYHSLSRSQTLFRGK